MAPGSTTPVRAPTPPSSGASRRRRRGLERLSAQDLITLWPEECGWPQDVGALAVLDADRLLDPDGRLPLAAVRAAVESRLGRVPRFRQVLYVPRLGLGRPLWVDAPHFDVADHVCAAVLPAPGDEAALLGAVERLGRRALPRSRPLWQMWLFTGLPGRRVGLYLRAHHALADGPSAAAMFAALLDAAPDATHEPAVPWSPSPAPTRGALLADAWRCRLAWLLGVRAWLAGLRSAGSRRRAARPSRRAPPGEWRAPRTSLNRVIGFDRTVLVARSDLEQVRKVAHAHTATVNDVLLTAVAGGLRDLLVRRGEPVDGVLLRAIVPVSLRRESTGDPRGNLLGSMVVRLPVGVADPGARLRVIAADTAERKPRTGPRRSPVVRSRWVQRAAMAAMSRQAVYNTYVANVPGPQGPLHLCGARLLSLCPVVALMGNLTLGVGALSYAGRLTVAAVGDRDSCPDIDVFAAGLRSTLRSLGAPADPGLG